MCGDLESVSADIAATGKSISVAKEKIRVNSELLDSGMITPLELSETKLELAKLNYEKYTSECRKNMIQYRIVNIIYK